MNTADRSISLFDTAMRRRFAFVPMMVDYDLVTKELGLGLEKYDEEQLKQLFTTSITSHQIKSILSLIALHKINKKIRNDIRMGKEKQIGHTYLLKIVHNENQYLNVWKFQILPLLEEFYSSKFEDLQNILNDKILDEEMGLRDFVATDLDELLNSIIGN